VKYFNEGSLQDYLTKEFKNLKWKEKISILLNIINGLTKIHHKNIIHCDFHSGNILHEKFDKHDNLYIADLGLSFPVNKQTSISNKNDVFGVLPYVAPEVLRGEKYTMASDIYSFGILMSVVSTGQQPFNNISHDIDLAVSICKGVRPGFSSNTPKFYIELAFKCMDADPDRRPTADEIFKTIKFWEDSFNNYLIDSDNQHYCYYSKEELDKLRSIRKSIDEMDKFSFDPSTIVATIHPNVVYTSRLLDFTNLPQPVNLNKITIIGNHNGNH